MKNPIFSEKGSSKVPQHTLLQQQKQNYDQKYYSPTELDISNKRNKANEYHSLLNRLPTLGEVLARKTQSPVDLASFYLFMQEHEGAIDYLDFWLEVMHHLTLCKHYVKGLRESIIRNSVAHQNQHNQLIQHNTVDEIKYQSPTIPGTSNFRNSQTSSQRHSIPLLEQSKHKSLSSSLLLEMIINDHVLEDTDSHRLSQFLRGDLSFDNNDPRIKELIEEYNRDHANEPLPNPQSASNPMVHDYTNEVDLSAILDQYPQRRITSGTNLLDGEHVEEFTESGHIGRANVASFSSNPKYVLYHSATGSNINAENHPTPTNPPNMYKNTINPSFLERLIKDSKMNVPTNNSDGSFVTRENLRESSHNLLLKYFIEDAEKKIVIPQDLNKFIVNAIEKDGRDDPDVFGGVRDYVFKLMESELFPKFLQTVAIQNVTDFSAKVRLISGLILLFFGLWISYILLFLDYAKRIRAVVVVPFLIAFYLIVSSIYYIDPILVFCGFSESFDRDRILIKLRERFVRVLLVKRSLWVLFLIILSTLVLTLIFSLVPGHRL